MSEDIKQAVRNVFENVWNQGDTSAADLIYADTYTAHIANVSSAVSGVEEFKQFVAMAHELPGGRSMLLLRSTRSKNGKITSNIVDKYGNLTIPRHLRDEVITEYGIADLRGKRDKDVIAALLNISDSRFQNELMEKVKKPESSRRITRFPQPFRTTPRSKLHPEWASTKRWGIFRPSPSVST